MYEKVCKDRFTSIENKLDKIIDKQDTLLSEMGKKVHRNSIVINGLLYLIGALTVAYIGSLFV